jgi:hypothetical protein
MGLRAKYDLDEDRMRLTLQWGEGAEQHFWVTRRLWLGLLFALNNLPPEALTDLPTGSKTSDATSQKQAVKPVSVEAMLLKNIQLRRIKTGTKLVFLTINQGGLSLDLSPKTIAELKTLLERHAASAAWDVEAFQARMSSAQMAKAAVQKARWH